jgi:hypothetical protein
LPRLKSKDAEVQKDSFLTVDGFEILLKTGPMKINVFLGLTSQTEEVISRVRGLFSNSIKCLSVCPVGGELCVAVKVGSETTWMYSDICHIFKRGVESRVKQTASQSAAQHAGIGIT